MNAIELQRRPLYSIGTVARMTGVKPDTLRVWERRYNLGASHKAPSGRRMFTQSDLEHLQIVAALVAQGTRIGDIAKSERRTLEMLLRTAGNGAGKALVDAKPRVLFLGASLCDFLESHQGCLARADAFLSPGSLDSLTPEAREALPEVDALVVEVGSLGEVTSGQVAVLAEALDTQNILVLYRYGNEVWLREVKRRGWDASQFPPDPAFLAGYLAVVSARGEVEQGVENVGDLAQARPRLFDDKALASAAGQSHALECECPGHIAELVRTLLEFERYSASCSVENWQDASRHACVYAYAGQARWLMEKALMLVTEAESESGVPGRAMEEIAQV